MINCKNFLIVLSTLLFVGCTSINKINSNTTTDDSQISPTYTSTLGLTNTPNTIITSPMAQISADTPTPISFNQLTFYEDFSSITQKELEIKFIVDCNANYQYLYPLGVFTIKVKQPSPVYAYCVLTPKMPEFERIDKVNVRLKYESGGDDSYIGLFSKCGDVKVGFWINGDTLTYTNNNTLYVLGGLPKSKIDYYDLSVAWGKQIQISVNGQKYEYKKSPNIFECSSYPTDLSIGAWLNGDQSINANIDTISIFGE